MRSLWSADKRLVTSEEGSPHPGRLWSDPGSVEEKDGACASLTGGHPSRRALRALLRVRCAWACGPSPGEVLGVMAELFASLAPTPLAERLRPKKIADVLGQDHLLGPDGPLGRMLAARKLSS